jgi:RNA polymerase sigma-70 factor (ECF subfamily)
MMRVEVEDVMQEVLHALFANDGRVLRNWDPEKGLSLQNYVGLVTERHLASMLRTGKRNPWREAPTSEGSLQAAITPKNAFEAELLAKEFLETVLDRLRMRLSPRGLHMFQALYVEQRSADDVGEEVGVSREAVHAWRARCTKILRSIANELLVETGRLPSANPLEALTLPPAPRK